MPNEIVIDILEDGTISMDTNKIPDAIHVAADQFKAELAKNQGGQINTTHKLGKAHAHNHDHDHEHLHAGGIPHTH